MKLDTKNLVFKQIFQEKDDDYILVKQQVIKSMNDNFKKLDS